MCPVCQLNGTGPGPCAGACTETFSKFYVAGGALNHAQQGPNGLVVYVCANACGEVVGGPNQTCGCTPPPPPKRI